MKKLTGKQKFAVGFVGTILAAALYVLSMMFGITPNWLADEPEQKPVPVAPVEASK